MRSAVNPEHRLTLVTGPTTFPVTLEEAKAQLFMDADDVVDEAVLWGLIRAATECCERVTRRALISQTWDMFLDYWPQRGLNGSDYWWDGTQEGAIGSLFNPVRAILIPKPPLQSITHIKTYDNADTPTTYSATKYFTDTASKPGRLVIREANETPWGERDANSIEIRFVAGYGDDRGTVPQALREGILRLTAWAYENRGACSDSDAMASGASAIWSGYKLMRF